MYDSLSKPRDERLTGWQFMATRPNTPLLLKGKHGSKMSQDLDLNSSRGGSPLSSPKTSSNEKEHDTLAIPKPNGAPKSGPDAVSVLEAKANGM
jgi:2-isopropylmalate synthase